MLEDELLDLRRKDVDAADDEHVVRAAGNLFHAPHSARSRRQEPREVARAVADDRQRFLCERGENQLAFFALRQQCAALRVDDLRVEVVLPDGEAVFRLDAFLRDTRADHLRETVEVDRIDGKALLDRAAHLVGPGLGTEDAQAQRRAARIDALAVHLVGDCQHVARRHHDDVGLEIGDQLHLALGHAAAEGNDGEPEPLGAVMGAEAAGEKPVAVGDMHLIPGPRARGADGARHEMRPAVDIARRVADDGGFARRTRGGVDAHDAVHRHGEHAEGIALAQVRLGGEREALQILERAAVLRLHARGVELAPVVRHVVVRVLERPLQPPELQPAQFVVRRLFNRLERKTVHYLPLKRGMRFSLNALTPSR